LRRGGGGARHHPAPPDILVAISQVELARNPDAPQHLH
jgi:hypothetical protein